ncbi:MAG: alpha/beta fold hydrolase [Bacteroidota bacterium]
MKKWFGRLLVVGLFLSLIALLGFHFFAPQMILQPTKRMCRLEDEARRYEPVAIEGANGIILQGYESTAPSKKGTIILVHGIGGCGRSMLGLSRILGTIGYGVIAFDNRAHGSSGGHYCTYGYYEKYDIKAVVDYLLTKTPDAQIGIWGNSLGGAIAIQALELDERIAFGITESTFTDFRTIVLDYKERLFGIRVPLLADYAILRASKIGNFNAENIRPIESVKNVEQPVLIAHGDQDRRINVTYGKTLFNNLASEEKELIIVEGGKHAGLSRVAGDSYLEKIVAFIDQLE